MSAQGFVCVINRNRDSYQVPLALEEAGLLSTFVTDFYAPDQSALPLPASLKARRAKGLSSRKTRSTALSFLVQAAMVALRLPTKRILLFSDRVLARHALRLAKRQRAHLYCYASYVPRAGELAPGMRLLNFEFHPLPHLTYQMLKADAGRFPEVAVSFANEENALQQEVVTDSWRVSDAIVCASNLTRRSLEHVGCDPSKITVVPYGFRDRAALPPAQLRARDGKCRFLFVGQGVQRKGLHHLIRAWQAAGLRDCELTLVCYHIDPGIRDLITDPSITLLGRQPRKRLEQIYAAADVFVMPSLVEGFGLVYLEAIEQGCHVIGTHDTGLPDLPLSGEAVTILNSGDLDGLQDALRDLRRRKLAGELDPVRIQAEIDKWTWKDFRLAIADHARNFLEGAKRPASAAV